MADLSARMDKLNPFSRSESDDDEDQGEQLAINSVAGGGRNNRNADLENERPRVSHALRSLLVKEGILSVPEAALDTLGYTGALDRLLDQNPCTVPDHLMSRSHPLPEYFISSSHNTYLMAHELYGTSSVSAYETALKTGSRCVEIDAWDNSDNQDEPKVTHGYTLVSSIPFRTVCETICQVFDEKIEMAANDSFSAAPIMLSLENHCAEHGQMRLVEIMKEVFGHRLLSQAVREAGHREQEGSGKHVSLEELGPRITVIVEYHFPGGEPDLDESSSSCTSDADEGEEQTQREARKTYEDRCRDKATASSLIIPELADLGVYAQSVKPVNNSWFDPGELVHGLHHHLINVSESGLSRHLPAHAIPIARHNAHHLMRVYPKGTRISSSNLKPVAFWGIGAQICALNWQSFGTSNQLNEALFIGSDGYVIKPAALRAGGDGQIGTGWMKRLRLYVAGATDIPLLQGREVQSIKSYLTCNLYSPCHIDGDRHKRKTSPYKHHKLGFLHRGENPPSTDPIWDETLEWVYEDNDLVFLRMLIKSDDAWARNPMMAVTAVRLLYAEPDWCFMRMFNMKGEWTNCTVLVKFTFEDA